MKPIITLEYCPKCGWLMRSAWYAQEILTTFVEELGEVSLRPSEVAGRFSVFLNEELLFDRKREGHFPEIKALKQFIRDRIAPNKKLGHSDTSITTFNS